MKPVACCKIVGKIHQLFFSRFSISVQGPLSMSRGQLRYSYKLSCKYLLKSSCGLQYTKCVVIWGSLQARIELPYLQNDRGPLHHIPPAWEITCLCQQVYWCQTVYKYSFLTWHYLTVRQTEWKIPPLSVIGLRKTTLILTVDLYLSTTIYM